MQHTFWIHCHCHWTDVFDRDNPATLPIQLCNIAERKLDMDLIVAEMKNGIDIMEVRILNAIQHPLRLTFCVENTMHCLLSK